MKTKTKTIEVSGKQFHIRRLPVDAGSFIFMRMMGASMRGAASGAAPPPVEQLPKEDAAKITGAEKVRALSFIVFSRDMNFEEYKFIQKACLSVVSVIEEKAGESFPMPVMQDNGLPTPNGEDLLYDVGLVMRLVSEVLIFCFADFFDESSPGTPV